MKRMENGHPDISEVNSESTDVDPYENKYYALLRRCENIQQSNERLVHRLYRIKGILRRLRHERRFLMRRLDQHEDNYRDVPLRIPIGIDDELPSTAAQPEVLHSASANSSSPFNLNAQSAEHDLLRSDVTFQNQLNTSAQSMSSNWAANSASTSSSTVGNATGHILPTSKKKNEKSSSKNSSKKSSLANVSVNSPPAGSGLLLKNALNDYGHLTKLNNDSSEKT